MNLKRSRTVLILHALAIVWIGAALLACMTVNASRGLRAASIVFTATSAWLNVTNRLGHPSVPKATSGPSNRDRELINHLVNEHHRLRWNFEGSVFAVSGLQE